MMGRAADSQSTGAAKSTNFVVASWLPWPPRTYTNSPDLRSVYFDMWFPGKTAICVSKKVMFVLSGGGPRANRRCPDAWVNEPRRSIEVELITEWTRLLILSCCQLPRSTIAIWLRRGSAWAGVEGNPSSNYSNPITTDHGIVRGPSYVACFNSVPCCRSQPRLVVTDMFLGSLFHDQLHQLRILLGQSRWTSGRVLLGAGDNP